MTIDIAAMLVSQTKEIIKILLLRVHQHGCYDVMRKRFIVGGVTSRFLSQVFFNIFNNKMRLRLYKTNLHLY